MPAICQCSAAVEASWGPPTGSATRSAAFTVCDPRAMTLSQALLRPAPPSRSRSWKWPHASGSPHRPLCTPTSPPLCAAHGQRMQPLPPFLGPPLRCSPPTPPPKGPAPTTPPKCPFRTALPLKAVRPWRQGHAHVCGMQAFGLRRWRMYCALSCRRPAPQALSETPSSQALVTASPKVPVMTHCTATGPVQPWQSAVSLTGRTQCTWQTRSMSCTGDARGPELLHGDSTGG